MSNAAVFSSHESECDQIVDDRSRESYPSSDIASSYAFGNQATEVTVIEERNAWLVNAHRRLVELARLKDNWDDCGAEAPNAAAVELSRYILKLLSSKDFEPTSIDPSAEGGVCISFRKAERYGDIECFNSGEILAVTSMGGDETDVWELADIDRGLDEALRRLRDFLGH
jgi:hypothetical protein